MVARSAARLIWLPYLQILLQRRREEAMDNDPLKAWDLPLGCLIQSSIITDLAKFVPGPFCSTANVTLMPIRGNVISSKRKNDATRLCWSPYNYMRKWATCYLHWKTWSSKECKQSYWAAALSAVSEGQWSRFSSYKSFLILRRILVAVKSVYL